MRMMLLTRFEMDFHTDIYIFLQIFPTASQIVRLASTTMELSTTPHFTIPLSKPDLISQVSKMALALVTIVEKLDIFIVVYFTDSLIYYFLQKDLIKSLEIFMTRLFASCLGNKEFGRFPLIFKTPVFGNADRFLYSEYCSLGLALT